MRTHFAMVQPHEPVSKAFNELIAGNQHDFPVVDDEMRLRGMVYRDDVLKALDQRRESSLIQQFTTRNCRSVSAEATLEQVFDVMTETECPVLPVVSQNRAVGLISLESIGEWLMIHSRGRRRNQQTAT